MQGVQPTDSVEELAEILKKHIKTLEDSGAKPVEDKPPEADAAGAQV